VVGAAGVLVLGLIDTVLGGLALARSRRTGGQPGPSVRREAMKQYRVSVWHSAAALAATSRSWKELEAKA